MRKSGQFLLLMLLVLGLYSLTSCGGATGGLGSSIELPGSNTDGVTNGDFKAIRYNDRGYADSALNPTLDLQVSQDGAFTTVSVEVSDQDPMLGACIDLFYDSARYSPVSTEFSGLVDSPLELASTRRGGIVSLGQASLDGTALRSGGFATVTFANSPLRAASAAGDAHNIAVNRGYSPTQVGAPAIASGFEVTKASIDATDAEYKFYSFFAVGDGNADGATTLGDLTAMVFNGYFGSTNTISATDWGTMPSDYNGDGETGVSDLTALGQRLGEATTSIDVLIKDNDNNDFAGTETVAANHTWASGSNPARPPAAGTIDVDTLMKNWTGTINLATAQAADTNGDGTILLSAISKGAGASGPAFTDATAVVTFAVGVPGVTVTGFNGLIDAATDVPFDSATTTAEVVAGENVSVSITGISGTYDPGGGAAIENFDGAPSASMAQADYDTSLANVQAAALINTATAGNNTPNEYRTSSAVLNLTGGTGKVTPDSDNPDSTGADGEGSLTVTIPASGAFVPLELSASITVDVLDDAAAPKLNALGSDQPDKGSYKGLNPAGSTILTGSFDLGTAALPADLNDVSLSLVPTYGTGDPFTAADSIDLNYTVDANPTSGNFTILTIAGPPQVNTLICNVPSSAVAGVVYGVHLSWDNGGTTVTSSVNHPDNAFCSAGDPPVPVNFVSIPDGSSLLDKNDILLVTYPDPAVRRDGRATVGGGNVTPKDPDAYADLVKNNGDSFALTSQTKGGGGFDNFPAVVVVQTNDPSSITSTTAGETVPVIFRGPGAVVLDLSLVTFGGAGDVEYGYKLFGAASAQADWSTLGTGSFTYSPLGIAPGGPAGIDYGINAFDGINRGELALGAVDYSTKTLNASSMGTATSDVLFVEVSNFGFYDMDPLDAFDYDAPLSGTNTRLRITDTSDGTKTLEVALVPVISTGGNTIALLEFTADHFSKVGAPGWTGILDPGLTYDLTLVDPLSPASDFTFTTEMIVVGVNPN